MDYDLTKATKPRELIQTVRKSFAFQNIDLVCFLAKLLSVITRENAPAILGIIHDLFQGEFFVHEHLKASFKYYMDQVLNKLKEKLPPALHLHIPAIVLKQAVAEDGVRLENLDILEQFQQLIIETLVKKSKYEIWNAINLKLSEDSTNEAHATEEISSSLIYYLQNLEAQQKGAGIRYIANLMVEEDIPSFLSYFNVNYSDAETFFIALNFYNKDIFDKATDFIYTEKKYFKPKLIKALPEIDIDQIIPNIKDYNWEIIEEIMQVRPDVVESVVDAFREGTLTVSRKGFLEKILLLDYFFAYYFNDLDLTEDEMIELSSKSSHFSQKYFFNINSEERMTDFCKTLSKKDEAFILEFIKNNSESSNFTLFLKTLTLTMRFAGELKSYVIDNFSRRKECFHILITYLDISEIEQRLGEYYEPGVSIESLLRKYHPQELLIEIHKFKDVFLAIKLINECIALERFENRDWAFAIKSLENIKSPIKMKTCLSLLKKKPQLRSQAILLLKRSITEDVWKSQMCFVGLTKCLEFLEEDCIQIFDVMNKDEIIMCLKKSPIIQRNLNTFFRHFRGDMPPKLRILKGHLSRI